MTKHHGSRWYQFGVLDLFILTTIVAVGLKLWLPGHTVVHYERLTEGTRPGQHWLGNGLGMQFRWCPAGEFIMGSPADEQNRDDNEGPVAVTLSRGFWLGKYEVTQAEWTAVMGSEPWSAYVVKEGDYHPATMVSHDEATTFCEKLTAQERAAGRLPADWEYRLPTEAQWEYACRAGSKARFCFGDEEAQLDEYAWFEKNAWDAGEKYAHEVGLKRANAWGLCDVHGNVWEWCRDGYQEKLPGGIDPEITELASDRVLRGGSWGNVGWFCRSAGRRWSTPDGRNVFRGFRLAAVQSGK